MSHACRACICITPRITFALPIVPEWRLKENCCNQLEMHILYRTCQAIVTVVYTILALPLFHFCELFQFWELSTTLERSKIAFLHAGYTVYMWKGISYARSWGRFSQDLNVCSHLPERSHCLLKMITWWTPILSLAHFGDNLFLTIMFSRILPQLYVLACFSLDGDCLHINCDCWGICICGCFLVCLGFRVGLLGMYTMVLLLEYVSKDIFL